MNQLSPPAARVTTGKQTQSRCSSYKNETLAGTLFPMSAENSLANTSDFAMSRIRDFFKNYRPDDSRDQEWVDKRKAAVLADIRRREAEVKEGLEP